MATTNLPKQDAGPPGGHGAGRGEGPGRPFATAANRVSLAGFVIGGLGLATGFLLVAELFESWRASPRAVDRVSIFGKTFSYPAANAGAVVTLVLAVLGSVVTARAVAGVLREVRGSRRFHRDLAGREPQLVHGALLIVDATPRAFCAGLARPRVYVSTGAAELLDDEALRAVLAHEEHHVRRRDPLRLAAGRVFARALFFLPGLAALAARQEALAELSADESAVGAAAANRSALARAMLSFADDPASGGSAGVDPARVDYLLGDPPSWGFPTLLCVGLAAVIALLAAISILIGRMASGSATFALPFLARQPCIVVLAAIPVAVAVTATALRRRLLPS